jgi:rSAM/selenodomain-associated transferase 1
VSAGPVDIVVLAKAPAPGRTKTRCTPPCSPEQAAALATAALSDTLAMVQATPARRRVLVLDGEPGAWLISGFEVVPQRGDGLDERLDAAMSDAFRVAHAPALLIGMDTPQVTVSVLTDAAQRLAAGADAVMGPANDGGYWAIGLQRPAPDAFVGVPMSTPSTGAEQHRRLCDLGLGVDLLVELRDVDTWADAVAVAGAVPGSGFASTVARISRQLGCDGR